jgi:hypothetical protein
MAKLRSDDVLAQFDAAHGDQHGFVRTRRKQHLGHKGGTNDGAELQKPEMGLATDTLTPAQAAKAARDAARHNLRMAGIKESGKIFDQRDARKEKKIALKAELAAARANRNAAKLGRYAQNDPAFAERLQMQQGSGGEEPQLG